MTDNQPDLWILYRRMLTARLFEEAVGKLWQQGRISGEMHLGTGEEAIAAGVVDHLTDNDALALDHRGTAPYLLFGGDPVKLLREFLGHPKGLCRGMGGHMHLFDPDKLTASSGIVGAAGPAAAGFALAAKHLRPDNIAVAIFGEGAMNQGALMESMNLAAAWRLPALFVCKDSQWAITTLSATVTGGALTDRAKGLGLKTFAANGSDVEAVWRAAGSAVNRVRGRSKPAFLYLTCSHLEGHFLGDALLKIARHPGKEMKEIAGPLIKSVTRIKGAGLSKRAASLSMVTNLIGKTTREQIFKPHDPIKIVRKKLKKRPTRLEVLETEVTQEINKVVAEALA